MSCTFTVSDFIKKWWKIFLTKACLGFSYEYQGDQIHKVNLSLWFFLAVRSSLCHWEYREGREQSLGQYAGYIPLPLHPTYSLLLSLLSFCLMPYLGSRILKWLLTFNNKRKKKKGNQWNQVLELLHWAEQCNLILRPLHSEQRSGTWPCPQLSWKVDNSREFSWIESRITSHPAPEFNSRRELHLPEGLQITACVVSLGNRASLLP